MKLVSFERNGRPGFGVVVGDGIVDAADRLTGRPRGLREALAAGALPLLERLAVMKPDFRQTDVTFTPVIPDAAAKLLCVGINYMPHIKEMGRERPERPVVFVRFGDSIVGHGQPLLKPRESEQFDFEGELAVIIGKRARRVAKEQRARLRRRLQLLQRRQPARLPAPFAAIHARARISTRAARSAPGS